MTSYRITSRAGVDLGTYEGETPEEAVRAMLADAGTEYGSETGGTVDSYAVDPVEASYHISNYGALASADLKADLDGYVHLTTEAVLGGRWDTGLDAMTEEQAEEIAETNRAATEESEQIVRDWREREPGA